MCLKTKKQWSRWLLKAEVLQGDMLPGPTELLLIGYSIESINLDTKIQVTYIDAKNQLADMLTQGNVTRDEWNHLLCLFNISHFSSTDCSEVMSKRTQKDSGEERVTAKSKPMMSLIARAPSTLSSSATESPGKKSYESQSPWVRKLRNLIEQGNPLLAVTQVTGKATTTDSWKARTRQATQNGTMTKLGLLKSGNLMNWWMIERGNPLFALNEEHSNSSLKTTKQNQICLQDPDHARIGWMIKCEKRQKRSSSNVTENDEKHSVIWGMFMSSTLESSVVMGKNHSDNWHSIKNTKDLTMKQMFDMSEKLVSEQSDEIYGVKTID